MYRSPGATKIFRLWLKKAPLELGVMAFKGSTRRQRQADLSVLVYSVGSRKATHSLYSLPFMSTARRSPLGSQTMEWASPPSL